jgi:hypothetical protein
VGEKQGRPEGAGFERCIDQFFFPTLLNVLVAGGKKRTLAKGKKSQYHEVEGALKNWIVAKRNKRILLTKRMVVGKVQCLFFPKP